jgi:hypothetical protein
LLRFARISLLPMRCRRSQFASAVICSLCGRLLVEGIQKKQNSIGQDGMLQSRRLHKRFNGKIGFSSIYPWV